MRNLGQSKCAAIFLLVASLSTIVGCAGSQNRDPHIGVSDERSKEDLTPGSENENDEEEVSPSAVSDAARPFTGYRRADDLELTEEELLTFLAAADAVCIGERHDDVLGHYGQLRTIEGFLERRAMRGFELGVGLEMVRASEQRTLTSFMKAKIKSDDLPGLLDWKNTWGFSFELYRPQLEAMRDGTGELLALGVDRELTKSIANGGIESLEPEVQANLPELERKNATHRALFEKMMEGHPGVPKNLNNYYDAQLLWDESMAEAASKWLQDRQPGRKLILLAGEAHCHQSAIVDRLAAKSGFRVTNLLIVAKGQAMKNPQAKGSLEEQIAAGYDYQMVFQR